MKNLSTLAGAVENTNPKYPHDIGADKVIVKLI